MRQCKIVGYRNSVNFDPNADEIVDEIYGNQIQTNHLVIYTYYYFLL